MRVAKEPQQGAHSAETTGQRTRPGKSFRAHHASSCTDCLWGKQHELHGPFLPGSRTHFERVKSSSFSCLSISVRTRSLVSYPNTPRQQGSEKFPNSVNFGEKVN